MIVKVFEILLVISLTAEALPFHHDPCAIVDQLKQDPRNCSQFFQCTTVGWVNMPCFPTLFFNPLTNECDYPENVKCPCESNKSMSPSPICTEKEVDELYPNPANCSTFLQCSPAGLQVMPCSPTLLYNDELKRCDYAANVNCESYVISDCTKLL